VKIEIIDDEKTRTYLLKDYITSSSIAEFEKIINEFIEKDKRDAVVDIKDVLKIDSLSLAVFLKVKNKMSAKGRKMILINPSESVKKIIEIASLEIFLLEE
jgi:anti-anti-sigma factor